MPGSDAPLRSVALRDTRTIAHRRVAIALPCQRLSKVTKSEATPSRVTSDFVTLGRVLVVAVVFASGHRRRGRPLRLGRVGDGGVRGEQQAGDGRGVLQGRADDLRRVDDARLDEVLERAGRGVVADRALRLLDLADDDGAVHPGVLRDAAQRLLHRALDEADARQRVALHFELLQRPRRAHQRDAAAGDDALLRGRARRVDGVLDAHLLLLHLGLGRGADAEDGDAARELRQALLQLLAVVVRGRLLDLVADGGDATLDGFAFARALDDGRVLLVHDDALGAPEVFDRDRLQLDAEVFRDDAPARQGRHVFEDGLAAVAEGGGLDGADLDGSAQAVDDERGERVALYVLGDDGKLLALIRHLFEQRQEVAHGRN